ncbi:hypothetical protein SGCOL_002857 [Colletotrichum sp. CLE4]
MKTYLISSFYAAVAISSVMAVPSGPADSIRTREIFAPEWEVQVTPGGNKVILNGTVQQVHAQLLELNPNWDNDFKDDRTQKRETRENEWQTASNDLDKRTDFSGAGYNCGI